MPRWRQVYNPETQKSEFVPIGNHQGGVASPAVHGDIQSFKSPIDGTVISDRKQYREHCEKHNVVPTAEFGDQHWEDAAKKRARFFNRERTTEEVLKSKQDLYERLTEAGY